MLQLINDPCFPQIGKVLDAAYMRRVLQESLFNIDRQNTTPGSEISVCEIGEKRHKPGKSFQLSYLLTISDSLTGVDRRQVVTAQLYASGQVARAGFEADMDSTAQSPAGIRPITYLPDINSVLRAFPFDRTLIHLPKLQDAEFLAAYFMRRPAIINLSAKERIESVKLAVMHYLPGQSCMTRYTLKIVSAAGERETILYGKNYKDDSGSEVFSIMQQLSGQIEYCAKPLYYDHKMKVLWQAHIDGLPFVWDGSVPLLNRRQIKKIATSIAAFHGCHLKSGRRFGMTDIIKQLKACCDISRIAESALSQRIQLAVAEILALQDYIDWTEVIERPVHLDLKLGNLLESNDRIVLIDLDSVCLGDPLADFGSFIANIYLNGLCLKAPLAEIDSIVTILIQEYQLAADIPVELCKLYWYIAAALMHEVVRRSLRQQSQERLQHLAAFISLSRRYCGLCRTTVANNADAV